MLKLLQQSQILFQYSTNAIHINVKNHLHEPKTKDIRAVKTQCTWRICLNERSQMTPIMNHLDVTPLLPMNIWKVTRCGQHAEKVHTIFSQITDY